MLCPRSGYTLILHTLRQSYALAKPSQKKMHREAGTIAQTAPLAILWKGKSHVDDSEKGRDAAYQQTIPSPRFFECSAHVVHRCTTLCTSTSKVWNGPLPDDLFSQSTQNGIVAEILHVLGGEVQQEPNADHAIISGKHFGILQ